MNLGSEGGHFRQGKGCFICELTTYDQTVTTSTVSFHLMKTITGAVCHFSSGYQKPQISVGHSLKHLPFLFRGLWAAGIWPG